MSFVVGIEGGGQIQILLEGATCDGVAGTNAKVVAVLKRAVEAKLKLDVNSPAATAMVSAKIGKRMPILASMLSSMDCLTVSVVWAWSIPVANIMATNNNRCFI